MQKPSWPRGLVVFPSFFKTCIVLALAYVPELVLVSVCKRTYDCACTVCVAICLSGAAVKMRTLMLLMVTALAGASQSPLDRVHAAADSLWATFWQPGQQYLLRDAEASKALLPFFSYQEATHAIALVAGLDYNKHGPQLKAMVSGQDRMNATRQPNTGSPLP